MKTRTKYILLISSIIGFALLIFNSVKMQHWNNVKLEIDLSKGFFLSGVISLGLYFVLKNWRNALNKIMIAMFGMCLILNILVFTEYYKFVRIENTISEYYELTTCEEMKIRFENDLENGEIKYFQFGIALDFELQKTLKTKYGIDSYGMGCHVQSKFTCYNNLVNTHLKAKHKDRIIDY